MSRKDYKEFAKMICELRKYKSLDSESSDSDLFLFSDVQLKAIFDKLCRIFYSDNGNFDREKFYTACGFDENKN